jgi:predicted Na+-dependent transporter
MDGALTEIGLPIALGIIMFGLGLDLTLADFRRVGKHPRAVVVALACQLVLLPATCFGLVLLFDLPWQLGIGMMLLAASPGGTTANLFSHLFRGDVALNITLTAINSVISPSPGPAAVVRGVHGQAGADRLGGHPGDPGARHPPRGRSACTTGHWRSSSPRTCSTAPRSRSRLRSTRC